MSFEKRWRAILAAWLVASCQTNGPRDVGRAYDVGEACRDVPKTDAERGPLADGRLHVVSTSELREVARIAKSTTTTLRGAEIYLRPSASATVSRMWLTQVSRCHAALHAKLVLEDQATDPLAVSGAEVDVREEDDLFVLRIHTQDEQGAREIVRRARSEAGSETTKR